MARPGNFIRKRTRSTFITALFSISLVLFFLALFSFLALYGDYKLKQEQEKLEMVIYLKKETTDSTRQAMLADISSRPYVREIREVSEDEAAELWSSIGEDFEEVMDGFNPLPASINVKLKHEYVEEAKLAEVRQSLNIFNDHILDVEFPEAEMKQLKSNIRTFSTISIGVGLIVMIIAWFIIRNTIQLATFSQRLTIRSMQLIGATNRFIRRPFIKMGVVQGLFAAIVAAALLTGLLYLVSVKIEGYADLAEFIKSPQYMLLTGGIIIFGSVLGWLSSYSAVNKFLHRRLDELM